MELIIRAGRFEIELGFLSIYLRLGSRDWYWNAVG
jgi:hypothetical protein